jgi:hypothetical protein
VILINARRETQKKTTKDQWGGGITHQHHQRISFLHLGDELARTAGSLNLLLGKLAEIPGFDYKGHFGESAFAENLEDSVGGAVEDGGLLTSLGLGEDLVSEDGPELVHIGDRTEGLVAFQVVVAHTNFTEETRVKLIEQGAVVVLATGVTATTGVGAMLTDTTMTRGDVSALLSVFVGASGPVGVR